MTKLGCKKDPNKPLPKRKRVAFITRTPPKPRMIFDPKTERSVRVSFITYKLPKRTPLKPVSKKQAKENTELKKLTDELRAKCKVGEYIYKSELSGLQVFDIEPHHLAGRGKNLLNPFTIIMVSRTEHLEEQKHMGYDHKQELRTLVKPIRLAQGYKEENYE